MGVEKKEEAVVENWLASLIRKRNGPPVEEDAEAFRETAFPVLFVHLLTVRFVPSNIGDLAAVKLAADEPTATTEYRVTVTETNELRREVEQILIDRLPVEP